MRHPLHLYVIFMLFITSFTDLLQHVFLRSKHKTENIDQVAQRLRDNYSAPLRNLAEQITSRCKLEKTAFSTLDDNSTKIEELIQSIDDITEKQVMHVVHVSCL